MVVVSTVYVLAALVPSLWITIFAFEFRCPELEERTACKCRGEYEWWTNTNVSIVNCSFSNLKRIPKLNALENYEITKFLLKGNNVTELTVNDFFPLQVTEIDLSRNPIGQLANKTLSSTSQHLTRLVLKASAIVLDGGLWFLRGLEQLEELVLDSNKLQNEYNILPAILFKDLQLKSLKKLSLKSCDISKIAPNSFVGLETVEEIDLSYNDLEEIPEAIKALKNLKKLVLDGNSITEITKGSFHGLHMLEEIDLDVNEVSEIEAGAFDGLENSLKELKLHYNDFSDIPSAALKNMQKLHFLVLSRNKIRFIQDNAFEGMPSLKMLKLDNNPLIFYKEMFSGLEDTIEDITLRSTDLTSIPTDALSPLNKLTGLDLSNNRISEPRDIGRLRLKSLALANNNIKFIDPDAFEGLIRPIGLDLDNNKISNMSFILHIKPCSFSYMDLVGNPVICDCDTEKIVNSGVMLTLRGDCMLDNGDTIDLSSSKSTKELTKMCNKTERTFSCQNFQYSRSYTSGCRQTIYFLWVLTLQFSLLVWL